MNKYQKGFAPIIVVVVIVLTLAGGGFIAWKQGWILKISTTALIPTPILKNSSFSPLSSSSTPKPTDASINEATGKGQIINLSSTRLLPFPKEYGMESYEILDHTKVALSLFCKKAAAVVEEKGKYFVISSDEKIGPYDDVNTLVFDSDCRLTYYAREGTKTSFMAHKMSGIPLLKQSDINERLAVGDSTKDGKRFVVINSREYGPYNGVSGFVFSPNGEKVAYAAAKQQGDKEFFVFVSNGKESKPYEHISLVSNPAIALGPNGEEVFVAEKEGKCVVVLNGKEIAFCGTSGYSQNPVFSKDGHLAYLYFDFDGNPSVVVDEKKGKTYKNAVIYSLVFSPDGKKIAYVVCQDQVFEQGGKCFVVVDGKEEKQYGGRGTNGIAFLTFSTNGKVAYFVMQGDKRFIVVDGVEGKSYDDIMRINFSPTEELAFFAEKGENDFVVVYNGKESKSYDNADNVSNFVFSKDGKLAYSASRKKNYFIVVDGQEGHYYEGIEPILYFDGEFITYIGWAERSPWLIEDKIKK